MSFEHVPAAPPLTAEIRLLWKDAAKRIGAVEFMDKSAAFAQELKRKYPDYIHRRVFHALAGSTMDENDPDIIEEDFPGDDSVVGFLQKLAQS